MVFLNDRKGKVGQFSARVGHKAFSYHPQHGEDEGINFCPNGGMLCLEGGPLPEFFSYVEHSLGDNESISVAAISGGLSSTDKDKIDREFLASDLFTKGRCKSVMYTT
jgi:hypothetical protein